MGKSENEIKEWKEYRLSLLEQKSKSDDDFEKYITFISAGALGLTISFIDKISPLEESKITWVIAAGWILLALTLFFNLLSHYLSSIYTAKSIDDIDEDLTYHNIVENISRRNKRINRLNILSILLLLVGIICILIFVIKNSLS